MAIDGCPDPKPQPPLLPTDLAYPIFLKAILSTHTSYRPLIDRLGLSASAACAVHCALMPMLVGALPALGLGFLSHGPFEVVMVSLSCVLGMSSVIRSWRLHRRMHPIMLMTPSAVRTLVVG